MIELSDDFFRTESVRLVSLLTRRFGAHRLQFAQDVAQETLVRALQTWPYRGMPDSPSAWLTQAAKNLAIDYLRREKRWREKQPDIAAEQGRWLSSPSAHDPDESLPDETLRMMFICFHPQLSTEAQTALALRSLCGLGAAEIASAFLTSESTISKRLTRARQRIRELELPFALPDKADLPARLDGVLRTLYLLFNEGYKASSGDRLVRGERCQEAIRLTRILTEHPDTCAPPTLALLALMLLTAARLTSRADDAGNLLRLREQDRSTWDQSMLQRGVRYLSLAGHGEELSSYHLEAGIAACHCNASDEASTDWTRILTLYDALLDLDRSPVTALNRAVAIAHVHGAQAGLDAITDLPLESYYLLHAVRGTLELDLGHQADAVPHFKKAAELVTLPNERDFIAQRLRDCGSAP